MLLVRSPAFKSLLSFVKYPVAFSKHSFLSGWVAAAYTHGVSPAGGRLGWEGLGITMKAIESSTMLDCLFDVVWSTTTPTTTKVQNGRRDDDATRRWRHSEFNFFLGHPCFGKAPAPEQTWATPQ